MLAFTSLASPLPRYTHFISLPLGIHEQLVQNLNIFKRKILTSNEYRGFRIDESIFAIPESLHLTVLMLELRGEDIAKASSVLQGRSVSDNLMEALKNGPISIQLRGLTCMEETPDRARIVYAPVLEVGEQGRLQQVCNIIIDAFTNSGLAPKSDNKRELKLHATVMNERFRKGGSQDGSFDAEKILKNYKDHEWGEYLIPAVHLSQSSRFDKSGHYYCCSSIPLPRNMQAE